MEFKRWHSGMYLYSCLLFCRFVSLAPPQHLGCPRVSIQRQSYGACRDGSFPLYLEVCQIHMSDVLDRLCAFAWCARFDLHQLLRSCCPCNDLNTRSLRLPSLMREAISPALRCVVDSEDLACRFRVWTVMQSREARKIQDHILFLRIDLTRRSRNVKTSGGRSSPFTEFRSVC